MIYKPTICAVLAAVTLTASDAKSVDDYIKAIRKHSQLPIAQAAPATVQIPITSLAETGSALVETEALKKPLTVSQFSEWLHNLYYDEEKKRKSAIKYMLESHGSKPTSADTYDLQ